MSPRRRAVLNPLVQRCTSAPTNRVGTSFPARYVLSLVGMSKGNGRLTPIKIIVLIHIPAAAHARNLGRWRYTTRDYQLDPDVAETRPTRCTAPRRVGS